MKNLLLPVAVILMLASCGESENPDARVLLTQADKAFEAKDFSLSTRLLDSLQRAYPSEVKIQREAMGLRPKVIEQQTLAQIASLDSMTGVDEATMARLKPELKWIKLPRMIEGYWIDAKAYTPQFMNTIGIEARVSEIGQFYIVSSVNPSNLKHVAISLSANSMVARTPDVPYDGESNYRIDGGEVITFTPEQSDTIGAFAQTIEARANSMPVTLTFYGPNGKKTVKLSNAQVKGIANAYAYSSALVRARDNQAKRQHLNKTLEIARKQAANAAAKLGED